MFKDEDVDIEEEIDLDDPIRPMNNEVYGEALLQKHYLIETEEVKGIKNPKKSTFTKKKYVHFK